jgi:amino acid adenylation domain-containing protein
VTVALLQHYVARQAERRPGGCALVLGERGITYGELETWANRLARLLQAIGCQAGDRVGLILPKSPAAVAGMLAILKAGCIYVPVDPESPPARLGRILCAADCRCVLVSAPGLVLLNELATELGVGTRLQAVWMEAGPLPAGASFAPPFAEADAADLSEEPPPHDGRGDAPAHLLFTSGSTGIPKGVMVSHANVIAFVTWANRHFGLSPADRVSCHSPLHFDLSTYDLYGGFAAGAEVHLVPSELNLFPHGLIDFIRGHRLTQWFSVPSVLTYLARFDAVTPGDFAHLRRILWCGEVFPTPALKYWMERLPHVTFTNLYGPTETTIASSYYTVPAPPADANADVPIGEACGGEEMLILDSALTPRAPGTVGDIYIGGAGVTLGYWRDPEKTRQVFLAAAEGGERLYRTGDLGYRDVDGLVHFLGRADSQIKSRGHRIELGEIEAALYTVAAVSQGAVVAIEAPDFGGHVICCAYVPPPGVEASPSAVKQALATLVPRYMLPARWRQMDALPANANGKVDRVALADSFRLEAESNVVDAGQAQPAVTDRVAGPTPVRTIAR